MITAHSPKWANAAHDTIEVIAKFPWLSAEVPFAASLSDPMEHGVELFNRAVAGEFGAIAQYVAPPLTLSDFQRAHDAFINAPALARNYDSFATFAMRAGYAGPYQAEAIAYAQWMDACNELGYQILAEVQAGTRQVPATTAEYLAMLPVLVLL